MDRETLAAFLDRDGEAYEACRRALLDGADYNVDEKRAIPVRELFGSYQVREKITTEAGIPTLGFRDALRKLHASLDEAVFLGHVAQQHPPYHFMLFIAADRSRVAACIGVDQDLKYRARSE